MTYKLLVFYEIIHLVPTIIACFLNQLYSFGNPAERVYRFRMEDNTTKVGTTLKHVVGDVPHLPSGTHMLFSFRQKPKALLPIAFSPSGKLACSKWRACEKQSPATVVTLAGIVYSFLLFPHGYCKIVVLSWL